MAETTTQDSATQTDDTKIIGASPKAFKARLDESKKERRERIRDWKINIDMRRAKMSPDDSDDTRLPVTLDWTNTKVKTSSLFSLVPTVVVSGRGPYKPAAPVVQERLNYRLEKAGVGATMDEVFPDAINAAGFGAAIVTFDARTEDREVPKTPLESMNVLDRYMIKIGLKKMEMMTQPFITDRKFDVTRLSPGAFLWPKEFKHSDFDRAPWLGHSGTKTWAEAVRDLGVKEEDKSKVLGDSRSVQDKLNEESREFTADDDVVCYDEIFYWRYLYHEDETHYCAIQRMVFVEGLDEPVINEKWNGQEYDEELGTYIGALRFPIRVLTLNYLSDEAIPPSDTAIGRPGVLALLKFREQMDEQRDHSKPIRWYDVNRIDADIQTALMMGEWQGFIPTQGNGDKAIGEVARSNYPREDMEFEDRIRAESDRAWGIGPNQSGTMARSGEHSATEARTTQGAFSTQVSKERALGVKFFLGIADVMLGLMALHDDFELPEPKDGQRLEMWDRKRISHVMAFSIRGDATVLLDAEQRIDRITRFLNISGKSGYAAPKPILEELASLSGLDPAVVLQDPPPQGPESPSVSFRFSGAEDLQSPMAVAILMGAKLAPSPEMLQAAIALIESAGSVVKTKLGTDQDEVEATTHVKGTPVAGSGTPPGEGGAEGQPPMADDRPGWQSVDRINSRRDASQE